MIRIGSLKKQKEKTFKCGCECECGICKDIRCMCPCHRLHSRIDDDDLRKVLLNRVPTCKSADLANKNRNELYGLMYKHSVLHKVDKDLNNVTNEVLSRNVTNEVLADFVNAAIEKQTLKEKRKKNNKTDKRKTPKKKRRVASKGDDSDCSD